MRLVDLNPEWEHENSYLVFTCPKCPVDPNKSRFGNCLIMIPIKPHGDAELGSSTGWDWNGETDFEKVTINPSIFHHCESEAHFWIRDGAIVMA